MSEPSKRIVIVDRPSAWREALSEALTREQNVVIDATDDGREIGRVLAGGANAADLVLVGSETTHVSGADALYLARELLTARGEHPRAAVFMITDVRSDIELLDVFRRRGVAGFVYRDDPLGLTVDRLRSTAFRDRRQAVRYPVRADAELRVGEAVVRGAIENLSVAGAQFVAARKKAPAELSQGGDASIAFAIGPAQVACNAVVRQLATRKAILADKLVVGLEFRVDDATRGALESAVRRVTLDLAVRGRLDPDDEPDL